MSQMYAGYGSRESLDLVLGTWEDKSRSTYTVELDATGYSCSVVTVRSSGEKLQTRGLIRLVDKPDGRASCIHWGKMFALDLETASSSQICWKHIDHVKDFHWWRSSTAEIAAPVAQKPKAGQAHSWHDIKKTNYEDALQAWGVSSSQNASSDAHRSPWPSWSEVEQRSPLSEMIWPAWARLEEHSAKISSAESSRALASSDETRSKLLEFLLARPELLPRRKDLLRQCLGGYFAGHIVHEADVEYAISVAEERLCNASGRIYEASPPPEAYLSSARDVASVTTSPGATNEGELSQEISENEATLFDPLGRAAVTVDDAESDISSEHFA